MGGSPYPGLTMEYLFEYLQTGHRMEQPVTCPDELYTIMLQCWKKDPKDRPCFYEIANMLERIIREKAHVSFFFFFERGQRNLKIFTLEIKQCKWYLQCRSITVARNRF